MLVCLFFFSCMAFYVFSPKTIKISLLIALYVHNAQVYIDIAFFEEF